MLYRKTFKSWLLTASAASDFKPACIVQLFQVELFRRRQAWLKFRTPPCQKLQFLNVFRYMLFRLMILCSLFICSTALYSNEQPKNKGSYRVFQFENEHVRVWRTVILPNQPLKMHRHDCSRVLVGIKGGVLTKLEETGETSEIAIDTGAAIWLTDDPPNTFHADLNLSNEPIEVMVIEIKALDHSNPISEK